MTGSERAGGGVICVHYYPHPLRPAANRQTSRLAAAGDDRVESLARRLGLLHTPLTATVNGVDVERSRWADAVVKPGDVLVLRQGMRGVEAGAAAASAAAAAGKSAAAVALAYAAAYVAVNLAIGLALSMLSNALMGKKSSGSGDSDATPTTYSIEGGSNDARQYQPLPLVLGEHRVFPDYASRPFAEFVPDPTTAHEILNNSPTYEIQVNPPFGFDGGAVITPWVLIKTDGGDSSPTISYYGDGAQRTYTSPNSLIGTVTQPHTFVVRHSIIQGDAVTTYEDYLTMTTADNGGGGGN